MKSLPCLTAAVVASALASSTLARADGEKACDAAYDQAQTLRDQHKLVEARTALRMCARPVCPHSEVQDCTGWLEEVEKAMPTVVFVVKDHDGNDLSAVRVTSDGVRVADHLDGAAVPVDPGAHDFTFEAPSAATTTRHLVIHESEKDRRINITMVAASEAAPSSESSATTPATSSGPPIGAYVALGIGGAALIVGSIYGITALNEKSSLDKACGAPDASGHRTCPGGNQSAIDSLHTDAWVANVAFPVALIAAGIGTYLLLTHRSDETPAKEQAATITPWLGIGAAGLSGSFQ